MPREIKSLIMKKPMKKSSAKMMSGPSPSKAAKKAGMTKPLPVTRRAVGAVVGAVAGPKAKYKYLAKKADYVTADGKFSRKKEATKPLPATRRAVGKVVGAVAGPKAKYKYLAKKADYVTADGKFSKKKK
jgi:hypothetical protein